MSVAENIEKSVENPADKPVEKSAEKPVIVEGKVDEYELVYEKSDPCSELTSQTKLLIAMMIAIVYMFFAFIIEVLWIRMKKLDHMIDYATDAQVMMEKIEALDEKLIESLANIHEDY